VPGTLGSAAEHAMHDQQRPELLKALELLERAQADVVSKAEAAAMWQARAELLTGQVEQLQRALPAPSERPPGGPANGLPDKTTGNTPTARRAWWRVWAR
jgi:hypothetical protein